MGYPKKKSGGAKYRRSSIWSRVLPLLFVLLFLIVPSLLYLYRAEAPQKNSVREIPPPVPKPSYPKAIRIAPQKTEIEKTEKKPISEEKPEPVTVPREKPRVAIVIDDMGYNYRLDSALADFHARLSLSFLPFGPGTKKGARLAHEKGKEVLLHLPMEPVGSSAKMGPGALVVKMDQGAISDQVRLDIEAVPYAKGINNHMGSKFTADSEKMKIFLQTVQEQGLFYLDSRTTPGTQGPELARSMGLRMAERHVFLDNVPEESAIRLQLVLLAARAREKGFAIGIGHAHRTTYEALKKGLPELEKKVKIVPVSELTR